MKKKWDKIQFCVLLALLVAATNSVCHFGECYISDKKIQIIKELGGSSPHLEEMKTQHWDDGKSNAFISCLLIYILIISRRNRLEADLQRTKASE